MGKRSKKDVKDDSKKLLDELKLNANASLNTLSKKLNFSRQKIWRIIKHLKNEKKIWGYTTVVDDKAFGYNQYFILLKRSNLPASEELLKIISSREVKKKLTKLDINMIGSYFVNGDFDWVIMVTAKDIMHVKITVEFFYNQLKDFIADVKILEVLFPLEKCGIENPNSEKIIEFFK